VSVYPSSQMAEQSYALIMLGGGGVNDRFELFAWLLGRLGRCGSVSCVVRLWSCNGLSGRLRLGMGGSLFLLVGVWW
jgi:hypothetical protein